MTIFLAALALTVVFVAPILLDLHRGGTDLLSPVRVIPALHVLTIAVFLFFAAFDDQTFAAMVVFHPSTRDLPAAVAWYAVLQALAFAALMAGVWSGVGAGWGRRLPVLASRFTPGRAFWAVVFSSGVGLAAFWSLLDRIGGWRFLLENTYRRAQLLAGMGYLYNLLFILSFGALVLVYSQRERRTPLRWAATLALLIGTLVIYSSFGGRRSSLDLMIAVLFTWHYGVRPIRRPKLVALGLSAILVPYFVAVPILRTPDGFRRYASNLPALGSAVYENLDLAVRQVSYVNQYVLIANHFTLDRVWLGKSYLDLLTAPIPSSRLPNKPPVDDGVYVQSIAAGQEVTPPVPARGLFQSSWPPETFGIMYMNFWIPGLVVGMFLLGVIYRAAYEYMRESGYSLFSIVMYGNILLNFHFSNLRLMESAVRIVLALVFFGLFFGLRRAARAPAGEAALPALGVAA